MCMIFKMRQATLDTEVAIFVNTSQAQQSDRPNQTSRLGTSLYISQRDQ